VSNIGIFLTGSSGFVGKNILKYFKDNFNFTIYNKSESFFIQTNIILHLAGKAHDLSLIHI
jgi:hypothetical protein